MANGQYHSVRPASSKRALAIDVRVRLQRLATPFWFGVSGMVFS